MAQFGHERTQAESRKAGKGNHIRIHGKDVSGHILVSDDDVEVHVHVGFAMMFREPIRVAIEGSIAKHIA